MAKLKLTAKGVAKLSTDLMQEDFWDALMPGLHLRVSGATGRKTWLVRYRANGTQRRMKIGVFPRMELAEARVKAGEVLAEADAGGDPVAEKEQEAQERAASTTTFRNMAEEVLEVRARRGRKGLPTSPVTQRERKRIVDVELLPHWGDREAGSITRREVTLLVEAIERRGAPVLANRTLGLIRMLYNIALRREIAGVEFNPAHQVEPPGVEKGRDRYLTPQEIADVWKATEEENLLTRSAFRLAFLTGQRIGSIRAMRWDGITEDLWTIPAEHFKGRRPHLVPLSAEARAIIEEIRADAMSAEWVFPSRARSKQPHMTNLGSALARVRERSGLDHWTLHDARTTWRTLATRSPKEGGLGVSPQVADAVLGHAEATLGFSRYQGDQQTYQLTEKREALEKWGAFVRKAVGS